VAPQSLLVLEGQKDKGHRRSKLLHGTHFHTASSPGLTLFRHAAVADAARDVATSAPIITSPESGCQDAAIKASVENGGQEECVAKWGGLRYRCAHVYLCGHVRLGAVASARPYAPDSRRPQCPTTESDGFDLVHLLNCGILVVRRRSFPSRQCIRHGAQPGCTWLDGTEPAAPPTRGPPPLAKSP
jgi:hypothetical protein